MARAKTTKKAGTSKGKDKEIQIDRRTSAKKRGAKDRRQKVDPVEPEPRKGPERRKVTRRRQIDPTTCERDYNNDEIEFMHALDAYKRAAGRMFPTCSEVLEVLHGLGYRRLTPQELEKLRPEVSVEGDAVVAEDSVTSNSEALDSLSESESLEESLDEFES